MQQKHAAGAQLWKPNLEVVLHRGISVQTVNMQEVDAVVSELPDGLIEGHSKQVRERRIVPVVVRPYILEHLFTVKAGMFVTLPGVHRVAGAVNAALHEGLAETEVGLAVVCSQLN